MTEKKCLGCGAALQSVDVKIIGYTPRPEMEYCQRCFRLIHYNRKTEVNTETINSIEQLKELDASFFWLIDISDLEESLDSNFVKMFAEKNCYIVLTKCDLLPRTFSRKKMLDYIESRINKLELKCLGIIPKGIDEMFLDAFRQLLRKSEKPCAFVGLANVGKSSFINQLLGQNRITVNERPGTTLAFNHVETDFAAIVDTAGLVVNDSVQIYLKDADLKKVVNSKTIRPKIYQLIGDQSIAIGGLARIDVVGCRDVSAVVYCCDQLKCRRSKLSKADDLWKKHLNEELQPSISSGFKDLQCREFEHSEGKTDFYVKGLGWICLSGSYDRVRVYADSRISVGNREAMI